jgi:hypothetical protein
MLINVDKYKEGKRLRPAPVGQDVKFWGLVYCGSVSSSPEEFEFTTSPTKQELVSNWQILTSRIHREFSISQSHDDSWEQSSSQRQNFEYTDWTECSYTFPKKNRDSYTCQNKNPCHQEDLDLLSVVILLHFRPFNFDVRQGNCPLFRNMKHHKWPITRASGRNRLKRIITSVEKCNSFELSEWTHIYGVYQASFSAGRLPSSVWQPEIITSSTRT